jgi:HemY protein
VLKAFVILLIIAAGLIIGPMWSGDSGTLILLVGNYSIEMSLVVATVILFIALFVIWLIKLVLQKLFRGHSVTLQWLRNRKQRQAEELLERAFTEWLAKNYVATAQLAEKAARHHIRPTQCYLMAASAYQALDRKSVV